VGDGLAVGVEVGAGSGAADTVQPESNTAINNQRICRV
jgi:hypothetical protein